MNRSDVRGLVTALDATVNGGENEHGAAVPSGEAFVCVSKVVPVNPESESAMSTSSEDRAPAGLDEKQIIDYIYDIALDPGNLDGFIDRLEADAAKNSDTSLELGRIQTLSALLESHVSRAEEFLDRVAARDEGNATRRALAPFDSRPALLVNAALRIVDANRSAIDAYGIARNDSLDSFPFEDGEIDKLFTTLRQLLRDRSGKGVLMALDMPSSDGAQPPSSLMHAHWVDLPSDEAVEVGGRRGFVLLVSTDVSWPLALDQTLSEVFGLTPAERDIVRALVEGGSLKSIASARNRSLGTVRTQTGSVLAKTRTHSQSELIRVTLSLMEIVKSSPLIGSAASVDADASPHPPEHYSAFETLFRPDGRRLDYLVQGDPLGRPLIFSHMGYGLMRWPPAALQLAFEHGIRIVSPVRSGFGDSDPVARSADILAITRGDTLAVMDHLGIAACTYVSQGNDLLFAMDLIAHHPDRITNLVGLGPRLPLPSDTQYAGMGRWHRFLLSTARHAPHLLYFTAKAAFTLAQKIGRDQMFRNVHRQSPADLAVIEDPDVFPTLYASSAITVSEEGHAAFAYAKELFASERDWSDLVRRTRSTPSWFVSGLQDPLGDPATIAAYREAFPWIRIEVIEDAGQLIFFQKFRLIVPRMAEFAHAGQ